MPIILYLFLIVVVITELTCEVTYDKSLIKAARNGDAESQFLIGRCFDRGLGVKKNSKKAIHWWKKAADQGHSKSQFNLGICYDSGDGVERDVEMAYSYFRKSSADGNERAICYLGICYLRGLAVAEDHQEAVRLFQQSANAGFKEAQYYLGMCIAEGLGGLLANHIEALKWLRLSSDQGYKPADEYIEQIRLPSYYSPPEDLDSVEQFEIGFARYFGNGVKKNIDVGLRWLTKSANRDNALAQYAVSDAYRRGNGLSCNLQEAINWFRKATDKGPIFLREWVDLVSGIYIIHKDPEESYFWLKIAQMYLCMTEHSCDYMSTPDYSDVVAKKLAVAEARLTEQQVMHILSQVAEWQNDVSW